LYRWMYRHTDGRTDVQMDIQTYRHTDGCTDVRRSVNLNITTAIFCGFSGKNELIETRLK